MFIGFYARMEASTFNFRYVRLCDLDIPTEKWLNYLPTVETLICLPITLLGVSRLQWINHSNRKVVKISFKFIFVFQIVNLKKQLHNVGL